MTINEVAAFTAQKLAKLVTDRHDGMLTIRVNLHHGGITEMSIVTEEKIKSDKMGADRC